jgi:hypothetical protein
MPDRGRIDIHEYWFSLCTVMAMTFPFICLRWTTTMYPEAVSWIRASDDRLFVCTQRLVGRVNIRSHKVRAMLLVAGLTVGLTRRPRQSSASGFGSCEAGISSRKCPN